MDDVQQPDAGSARGRAGHDDDTTQRSVVVVLSLRCKVCGYELRGLDAEGRCPECGLGVRETIAVTVEPPSRRLSDLHNAAAVGAGLLMLSVMLLCATLYIVLPPANRALGAVAGRGQPLLDFVLFEWPYVIVIGTGIFIGVLVALWLIAPARHNADVSRIRWHLSLVGVGALLWYGSILAVNLISSSAGWIGFFGVGICLTFLPMLAGLLAFVGLRGIVQTLGRRSRQFRTARGSRQYVRDLIAALVSVALGEMVRQVGLAMHWQGPMVVGSVIVWVAGALLILGQCYLVWNTWWVRQALLRPAPTLTELVRVVHDD